MLDSLRLLLPTSRLWLPGMSVNPLGRLGVCGKCCKPPLPQEYPCGCDSGNPAGFTVVIDSETTTVDGASISGTYELSGDFFDLPLNACYWSQVVNCISTPGKCFYLRFMFFEIGQWFNPAAFQYLPEDLEEGDRVLLLQAGPIPFGFDDLGLPKPGWIPYTRFIKVVEAGQTLNCESSHELAEVDESGDPVPGGPVGLGGGATITAGGPFEWDPDGYLWDYLRSPDTGFYLGIGCLPNRFSVSLSGFLGGASRFNGIYFLDKTDYQYDWRYEGQDEGEWDVIVWLFAEGNNLWLDFFAFCPGTNMQEVGFAFWTTAVWNGHPTLGIDITTVPAMQWEGAWGPYSSWFTFWGTGCGGELPGYDENTIIGIAPSYGCGPV